MTYLPAIVAVLGMLAVAFLAVGIWLASGRQLFDENAPVIRDERLVDRPWED